ncbi:MAG: hypothetical protein R3B84_11745 [Zavarzinella sp.]
MITPRSRARRWGLLLSNFAVWAILLVEFVIIIPAYEKFFIKEGQPIDQSINWMWKLSHWCTTHLIQVGLAFLIFILFAWFLLGKAEDAYQQAVATNLPTRKPLLVRNLVCLILFGFPVGIFLYCWFRLAPLL